MCWFIYFTSAPRPQVVSREVCHIKQGLEQETRNWCELSLSSTEICWANKTLKFSDCWLQPTNNNTVSKLIFYGAVEFGKNSLNFVFLLWNHFCNCVMRRIILSQLQIHINMLDVSKCKSKKTVDWVNLFVSLSWISTKKQMNNSKEATFV